MADTSSFNPFACVDVIEPDTDEPVFLADLPDYGIDYIVEPFDHASDAYYCAF